MMRRIARRVASGVEFAALWIFLFTVLWAVALARFAYESLTGTGPKWRRGAGRGVTGPAWAEGRGEERGPP